MANVTLGYGPAWRVDGPFPQPPLYTLLNAARVIDDEDELGVERWGNGVQVYPFPKDAAHVEDPCATGTTRTKATGGTVPLPTFGGMLVYLAEQCSSFGIFGEGLTAEDAQTRFLARAAAVMAAVEGAAVEREFLAGDALGNNPHLADGNGRFPWADVATSVVNGFSVLEDEIAASGRRGVIHVTPSIATIARSKRLIEPSGDGSLRTVLGTPVVAGYGYARTYAASAAHPANHPAATAGQDWAYATGPIDVRRSKVFVTPENFPEAFDRATNTVAYLVERIYAVSWDTEIQSAVLLDRCSDSCGSLPS